MQTHKHHDIAWLPSRVVSFNPNIQKHLHILLITLQLKHLPVSNMPEVMAVLGWVLIALYAILGRRWKVRLPE